MEPYPTTPLNERDLTKSFTNKPVLNIFITIPNIPVYLIDDLYGPHGGDVRVCGRRLDQQKDKILAWPDHKYAAEFEHVKIK